MTNENLTLLYSIFIMFSLSVLTSVINTHLIIWFLELRFYECCHSCFKNELLFLNVAHEGKWIYKYMSFLLKDNDRDLYKVKNLIDPDLRQKLVWRWNLITWMASSCMPTRGPTRWEIFSPCYLSMEVWYSLTVSAVKNRYSLE